MVKGNDMTPRAFRSRGKSKQWPLYEDNRLYSFRMLVGRTRESYCERQDNVRTISIMALQVNNGNIDRIQKSSQLFPYLPQLHQGVARCIEPPPRPGTVG